MPVWWLGWVGLILVRSVVWLTYSYDAENATQSRQDHIFEDGESEEDDSEEQLENSDNDEAFREPCDVSSVFDWKNHFDMYVVQSKLCEYRIVARREKLSRLGVAFRYVGNLKVDKRKLLKARYCKVDLSCKAR